MPTIPTVNVIGINYPYGMSADAKIVTDVLNDAGFKAVFINSDFNRGTGLWNRIREGVARGIQGLYYTFFKAWYSKRELNLFLERTPLHMFQAARRQVLIPNQEHFLIGWKLYLKKFDHVVCKTRHAEEIFHQLGCRTSFSSFTSLDRRTSFDAPKSREFLMITANRPIIPERVLKVWAQHPEWPRLTISGRHIPPGVNLPNVVLVRDFIATEELRHLQNSCLFHLCVTAAEGFGHKLCESLSCGAVVVATDAPPMNEIIQPDRGLLVKWNQTNPKGLGAEFHFDEADFERTIERCLELTPAEITSLSSNGRAWFEQNDKYFRNQLPEILRDVLRSKNDS